MLFTPAPTDPRATPTALPRSIVAFGAIAVGIIAARYLPGPSAAAWFSAGCAACAIAGLLDRLGCRVALFVGAVALGAGWFALRIHEAPAHALALHLEGNGAATSVVVTIEGVATESPRLAPRDRDPLHPIAHLEEPSARFMVRVDTVVSDDGLRDAVAGALRVVFPSRGAPQVRAGDRVRITGQFRPVPPPMSPGETDRRLWAAQDGEAGTIRAPNGALVERLNPSGGLAASLACGWYAWREALQHRARAALLPDQSQSDGAGRALLAALLLGEDEPALRETRSAFTRLGLAHVLAISGFHLTVMAWLALLMIRMTGDRGWLEPALIAALVIAYLVILPVQAPIWRSGLMTLGLLAADGLCRRYHPLALLGWIAVLLVLWRPMDLWSMGFQLSFGLVGLLMWLGHTTYRRLYGVVYAGPHPTKPRTIPRWAFDWARAYFSSSLLCWVVAAPLVIHHTGLVSTAGLVASLVILPPILLLLAAGYAALAVGALLPGTSGLSAGLLERLSAWTIDLVRWMDEIPFASMQLPSVSVPWAVAATMAALYWFARGHARDGGGWAGAACVVLWLTLEIALGARLPSDVRLRIDMLAVGDGTCHLIRSRGEAVLWDCGSLTPGIGRRVVPRAVRVLGAWRVPTAIVSHPNLDHFNGLLEAARPLGIRRFLVGQCFMEQAHENPAGPEAFVLHHFAANGIGVEVLAAGDTLSIGGATLTVLSPQRGVSTWNDNDRSLVAEIAVRTDGGLTRRVLMTGDIQGGAIGQISQSRPGLRADIVEAPHHGSAHDPAIKFVAALDPTVVLQSTGPDRVHDARWDVVRKFREWYTTATDGAAWAEVRADGSIRSGAMWRR